jgi:N,N'-diacetyllegionaminate synthase
MRLFNQIKKKCITIAEIGPNHNGSLKRAYKLIDSAHTTGCSGVKFQYRIADEELIDKHTKSYYYNESRYNFIKRVQEFSHQEHMDLREYVRKKNMYYVCSVFSEESIKRVKSLKPDAIKIPSGEVNNLLLLKKLKNFRGPIIISSGMSSEYEIDVSIKLLKSLTSKIIILHCLSEYPTKTEDMNLSYIKKLKDRYSLHVGLSDHSRNIEAIASSIFLGVKLIEVHFTMNRKLKGPDHHVSLLPFEMKKLVRKVNNLEISLGISKKILGSHKKIMQKTFSNCLVASKIIRKGVKLNISHLKTMKPLNGIPVSRYKEVLGKRLKINYKKHQLIKFKDLK